MYDNNLRDDRTTHTHTHRYVYIYIYTKLCNNNT